MRAILPRAFAEDVCQAIVLDHTIVPARDHQAAARFFAQISGLKCERAGYFAPVRVDEQTTLLFDDTDAFQSHHYAFHVSDAEFDAIFDHVKAAGTHIRQRAGKRG